VISEFNIYSEDTQDNMFKIQSEKMQEGICGVYFCALTSTALNSSVKQNISNLPIYNLSKYQMFRTAEYGFPV
jgi:hypothetical protein